MNSIADPLRLDKWLWHARFFKTRSLAAKIVQGGKVRVNGTPVSKPSRTVQVGDVLTFAKEQDVRVIKVLALGTRRGPASEAQTLYEDLAPPEAGGRDTTPAPRSQGRPNRRDRRAQAAFKRDLQ